MHTYKERWDSDGDNFFSLRWEHRFWGEEDIPGFSTYAAPDLYIDIQRNSTKIYTLHVKDGASSEPSQVSAAQTRLVLDRLHLGRGAGPAHL